MPESSLVRFLLIFVRSTTSRFERGSLACPIASLVLPTTLRTGTDASAGLHERPERPAPSARARAFTFAKWKLTCLLLGVVLWKLPLADLATRLGRIRASYVLYSSRSPPSSSRSRSSAGGGCCTGWASGYRTGPRSGTRRSASSTTSSCPGEIPKRNEINAALFRAHSAEIGIVGLRLCGAEYWRCRAPDPATRTDNPVYRAISETHAVVLKRDDYLLLKPR